MLHHKESPEQIQYKMAVPPFCLTLCPIFQPKYSDPPSISINFEKSLKNLGVVVEFDN